MQTHGPVHETLIERIVVGDLPRKTREARALLDGCSVCRERLREIDTLQQRLAAAGEEERDGAARSASGVLDPKAQQRIDMYFTGQIQKRRSIKRRVALVALAASLIGVIAFRLLQPSATDKPVGRTPDVMLGDGSFDLVDAFPNGRVKKPFDEFSWHSAPPLQPGETYRLRVTNLDAPDTEPLAIANIGDTSWRPELASEIDAPQVRKFFARAPRNIEWTVEIGKLGHGVLRRSSSMHSSLD